MHYSQPTFHPLFISFCCPNFVQNGLFEAMDSVGFSKAAQCYENTSLVLFDFEFNPSNVAPLAPARTAAGASNLETQPA